MELFRSVQQGFAQRGATPGEPLRRWGAELAGQLLEAAETEAPAWTNTPFDTAVNKTNPWFVQSRASADGETAALFLCSLPPGGESLTGVLRSAPFVIPPTLTFWIAGHDGFPTQPAHRKNLVRLRAHDSDNEVLAEASAPRNDIAQRVSWDLASARGREGVIELVDADAGAAYAWLAAGRFDPPVAIVPKVSPNSISERQKTAASIVGTLRLHTLENALAKVRANSKAPSDARAAAAAALLALDAETHLAPAGALLNDARLPLDVRAQVGRAIAERNLPASREMIAQALRIAPEKLQLELARPLAGSSEGADVLLRSVSDGIVPPQILNERAVHEKLVAVRPGDAKARIAQLTAALKPSNERLIQLVAERRAAFFRAKPDAARGARIFGESCAVCHSLGGTGGNIGPQLDGVGLRGLDRLCEDILDPNRNVDRVFRHSIVTLKNGEVLSGLFRREEGNLLVFADAAGKEFTAPKALVQDRRESDTSLMPEIFGDLLPAPAFADLLAFLLGQQPTPTPSH